LRPIIFLDRDGVINYAQVVHGKPKSPRSISELKILDGVVKALDILKDLNFEIVVTTNQPDISRKLLSQFENDQINEYLSRNLDLKHIYTCPHSDEDLCNCRKPKTGMMQQAFIDLGVDSSQSYLVGDRWSDILAGQTIGAKCFYIDYNYEEEKPRQPHLSVNSLLSAALIIRMDFKYVSDGKFES
jgi:histidinol-phosphate phosphatase family protein